MSAQLAGNKDNMKWDNEFEHRGNDHGTIDLKYCCTALFMLQ
ncbi:hypothetical protein [Sphingobacterium sp. SRCM116780]|nr:hypothetical protein [Sphingobacterium sp. SRCM116780]